jgi:hypothetical protein
MGDWWFVIGHALPAFYTPPNQRAAILREAKDLH